MSSGQAYWHEQHELEAQEAERNKLKQQSESLGICVEKLKLLKEFQQFWDSNKSSMPYGFVVQGERILDRLEIPS
jgi:hypothetical protein